MMKRRKRTYRHKGYIKQRVEARRNDLNEPIYEEKIFATVRAEIDPLRGREYFASRQLQAEQTHRISFRYIPNIKPSMWFELGEGESVRIFDIVAPPLNPYEANYEIQLMCKERVK